MKKIVLFIAIGIFFSFGINAQKKCYSEKVDTITEFKNLFRYQNFYLSGQPTLEELHWLKQQGVTKIINLRTESENKDFSENAFCEESNALALGFTYVSFPVNGATDYTPEMLDKFSDNLNSDELILIHCASATRVTYFFMAYLIAEKAYSVNDAVLIGKRMKFVFPLEDLLGTEIEMKIN